MGSIGRPPPYRHPPIRDEWLGQLREPIVDPQRPIIDAHHHLWDHPGSRYLADEFVQDLDSGHNVVATIYVQAGLGYRPDGPAELRPVGETETVIEMLSVGAPHASRIAAGVVSFADLSLGRRVRPVLEAHLAAGGGRFRGIRHVTARDPNLPDGIVIPPAPAGLHDLDAFRDGFRQLGKLGLSFDAWIYHCQLSELARLARAFPDIPITLNHMGGLLRIGYYAQRDRQRDAFANWRRDLATLAACENVTVKLGGLGMLLSGFNLHLRAHPPDSATLASLWGPRFEECISLFGAQRCMFESNFPVDKAMVSYHVFWNGCKRAVAMASESEKSALFHDTAHRFYRLGED